MRIAMCASEVVPFAKTGGLADVAGALPVALEKLGHEVIIIMPGYKETRYPKSLSCRQAGEIRKLSADIAFSSIGENIKAYFIKNDAYFNRDGLYQDKKGDYKDNLERFTYFCRRAIVLLKEINFKADIIHVHDWQACLVPVYLKSIYKEDPFYKKMRTILTIHNIGYQGIFPKDKFPKLALDWGLFDMKGLEYYGQINLLKGGIIFSDIINTVSPTYSKEIQTEEFGFGLEGVLSERKDSLFGILNGLDYSIWDPESDKFIARNFSYGAPEGKNKNKEELQKLCNFPVSNAVPVLGIVSRLAEQKGFDILAEAIEDICKLNLQLVILGTGEARYHELLGKIAKKYPKTISLHLKFDDPLAHKIYAASDIFLMPSRYEPCGLGQLISLRYGTIPVVFKTGGLADTVNKDNGFVFAKYEKADFLKAIKSALKAFRDKEPWACLMQRAMKCDFSWEKSARQYIKLYKDASAG